MSVFWSLMSAISAISGNFVTRCPKCSAKMRREEMHEQAYVKTKSLRTPATSTFRTEVLRRSTTSVRVVPIFDVCTKCGHRVRRKSGAWLKSPTPLFLSEGFWQ